MKCCAIGKTGQKGKMMKFKYYIELKEGYRPVMETELETNICIVIEAKNRATADRAINAMLKDAPNIKEQSGICSCPRRLNIYIRTIPSIRNRQKKQHTDS